MYKLPLEFDISKLIKKELTAVLFTENTINLSFELDISITIIGSFIHSYGEGKALRTQILPVTSSKLMRLIGKKINFAEEEKDGGLTLYFENNDILQLLNDYQYESFSIIVESR